MEAGRSCLAAEEVKEVSAPHIPLRRVVSLQGQSALETFRAAFLSS